MEITYRAIAPYIDEITRIVFLDSHRQGKVNLLFLFGGSYPGLWETAINLYSRGLYNTVIITGGVKPGAHRHETWNYGDRPEADVIREKLIGAGIPGNILYTENTSRNSLENVLNSLPFIDKIKPREIGMVCKNYGAGRQYRTLRKHIDPSIEICVFPFDTDYHGTGTVTRTNWHTKQAWIDLVLSEYGKIVLYGNKGNLELDFKPIPDIGDMIARTKIESQGA